MNNACLKILNQAVERLRSAGVDRPRTTAELLLGAVLDAKKIDLYLNPNRLLTSDQIGKFNKFLEERIKGKPIQYIIGSTEFFGLEFEVNPHVLIPRPETETLVEKVMESLRNLSSPEIIDLGTGSGAIAISLARNIKDSFVYAVDISSDALKVARRNARKHGVEDRMDFLCGDLFEPLRNRKREETIDCVVSNPPYVSQEEFDQLPGEVKDYEPIVALRTEDEGTSFHKRIIRGSLDFLKEGGILALEVGLGQANEVANLIADTKKFKEIKIERDLGGIERIVMAYKA